MLYETRVRALASFSCVRSLCPASSDFAYFHDPVPRYPVKRDRRGCQLDEVPRPYREPAVPGSAAKTILERMRIVEGSCPLPVEIVGQANQWQVLRLFFRTAPRRSVTRNSSKHSQLMFVRRQSTIGFKQSSDANRCNLSWRNCAQKKVIQNGEKKE